MMKNAVNQRMFADIMKAKKSQFRREKFESHSLNVANDPLAWQLPTGKFKIDIKILMTKLPQKHFSFFRSLLKPKSRSFWS